MTAAEHSQLVHDILAQHGARTDCRLWRANVLAARTRQGGLVRAGIRGQADISGIYKTGRRIEIECKTGKARRSSDQIRWQIMIESMGGAYCLAHTVQDVEQFLGGLGAERYAGRGTVTAAGQPPT